jgi:hypothetical protein
MALKQISVFLENNAGRLAEVTRALSEAGVNLRAISIADTADFGILRLIVDKTEPAIKTLVAAGFTTRETPVIAVEIGDKPGALAGLLELFQKEKINIEYLYATRSHEGQKAIIIIKVDNDEAALAIIKKNGLVIVETV